MLNHFLFHPDCIKDIASIKKTIKEISSKDRMQLFLHRLTEAYQLLYEIPACGTQIHEMDFFRRPRQAERFALPVPDFPYIIIFIRPQADVLVVLGIMYHKKALIPY